MSAHLPVLLIVLPMLAAPLCALMPRGRAAWGLATLVSWGALWLAGMLLLRVLDEGVVSYAIGGWAAPWGIEYRVDALNAFVVLLVAGIGAAVTTYCRAIVEHQVDNTRITLFYTAYLLCLTGLMGIAITGDAFNVFVFLEISSLSSYAMIAMGRDRRALTASYHYLVMGTIGATFILIGIGLLYMMTGTLNMADLAHRLQQPANINGVEVVVNTTRTVRAAFAFLTVGFCLKLAVFPLHLWLPNAYAYAPSAVTIFLSATATKVALCAMLRFFFTIFGAEFSFETMNLDAILLPLSLIALFAMSIVAIFQQNVKRVLAYSSVAQIGYMILGISIVSLTGLTASILHMFNHAVIKASLFMALGCVVYRTGSVQLESMAGLGRRMPWTMAAFVAGGFSLIGVPLSVGFVSKWYLIRAALEKGWWPVAAAVVLTSLLAFIYIWRVIDTAYFRPGSDEPAEEAPLSMLLPTWALITLNFYFGIDTTLNLGMAERAAAALLGAGT